MSDVYAEVCKKNSDGIIMPVKIINKKARPFRLGIYNPKKLLILCLKNLWKYASFICRLF
ncbi:hypothetical protein J5U22_00891 [Saccharolobus shibatae]|uniref:Uncharacterized protein n=1 Tax=Saccharolobus shibatae TaxID=2286 RepID=A0A8F5BZT3_9CREN|nr:hypothetical protein J5U22_00891 [Saccharolobus shibatae]